ncbi:MAG: hypothetical protein WCT39_02955 [Candidatus Margulisiibacteriota bacterium]
MKKKIVDKDVLENIRWFSGFSLEKRLKFADRINDLLGFKKLGYSHKDAERSLLVKRDWK